MAIRRSDEMWLAAYAMARCGDDGAPPAWLGTASWNEAYDQFYPRLNDGRTRDSFAHSLKNARDTFDPYVDHPVRTGWRASDHSIPPPRPAVQKILDTWKGQPDEALRDAVLALRNSDAGFSPLTDANAHQLLTDMPAARSSRSQQRLPAELLNRVDAQHVWNAVQDLLADPEAHPFGESTDFDLIVDDGVRLPPKAVFGLAATEALGFPVLPIHFTGGLGTLSFRALTEAGFQVVPKGEVVRTPSVPTSDEDRDWTEGRPQLVQHLKKERARGLSRAKKASFIRENGRLFCERCEMDPVAAFGPDVGETCIEVHHRKTQVAKMGETHRTRLEDVQCLCANCHRVVHALLRKGLPA